MNARVGRWEGVREQRRQELPPFPSSHRPPRALLFFWDTQREPLRRRELLAFSKLSDISRRARDKTSEDNLFGLGGGGLGKEKRRSTHIGFLPLHFPSVNLTD